MAVVILNWNGRDFLRQFLPSAIAHSSPLGKVYVADNASTDGSVAMLREEFPEVTVIETGGNLGYAGGYNAALRGMAEPYAVLLNSDVEVTEGWLSPQVALMDSDPTVAACQPKLRDFQHRGRFEYAGAAGGFIDRWGYPFCRGRMFNTLEDDLGQYDHPAELMWASGACLMVRLEAFRSVNGLDADFFAHMEEIDLCWRMRRAGWRVMAAPSAVVYHVGGGTLHKSSPRKTFLNFKNGLELLVKNLPARTLPAKLLTRLVMDGAAGMRFLLMGDWQHTWAVVRAHFAFYACLSRAMRKRSGHYPTADPLMYCRSVAFQYFVLGRRRFSDLPR